MEFDKFLAEIKREEKDFLKSFSLNNASFSVTFLNSFKLQYKFEKNDKSYYFKSNATEKDFADYGEFLASIIAKFVGIDAITTHLVKNDLDYGVIMNNFKKPENEYISLSDILYSFDESEMQTYDKVIASVKFFCEDNDIICDSSVERDLKRLILFDYMLLQQDRHGENIEFEISKNDKNDSVLKLSPIYDNEYCFLFLFDERIWDNYKYNEKTFLSRIFAFSSEEPIKELAKEVIKSEDLTNILERFMKIDVKKIIDLCDELSSKKMPVKYKNLLNSIFKNQRDKLCSEIKILSIKQYCEDDENEC